MPTILQDQLSDNHNLGVDACGKQSRRQRVAHREDSDSGNAASVRRVLEVGDDSRWGWSSSAIKTCSYSSLKEY